MRKQRKMACLGLATMLCWAIFLEAGGNERAGRWLGTRKVENGIEVISNSASPQYGQVRLDFREVASIACGENRKDIFNWIDRIVVAQDDSLYALDGEKCSVYHFDKNGVFLGKFGKKGEGPGDFKRPSDLYCDAKGNIYVLDETRISVFNAAGENNRQIKLQKSGDEFSVVPDGGFIVSGTDYSEKNSEYVVEKYDERFNKYKELFRVFAKKNTQRQVGKKRITYHLDHVYQPQIAFDKTISGCCIFGHTLEYALNIVDKSGKVNKIIKKEEKPAAISEREKSKIYDRFASRMEKSWSKEILREALQFPAHRPFFNRIIVDDQGRIFVFRVGSVLDSPKSEEVRADLFNQDGHLIYEVLMPFVPDFIKNGIFYRISEDEESGDVEIKLYHALNWGQLEK